MDPLDKAAGESERVKLLSKLLNQQQGTIYRQQYVSAYFDESAMRKVAERTWEQIHPNIGSAVEVKFQNLFAEFAVYDKLKEVDKLKGAYATSAPAWRPSGIPSEDHSTAASVEARDMLADFESKYFEVQKLTLTINQTLTEKKEHLQRLESQINTELKAIAERVPSTEK